MNKPQITAVYDPDVMDWEALYIDGKQAEEGHSLNVYDVLRMLDKLGVITYQQVNGTPAFTGHSFPNNLEDVLYDPDHVEEY